MPQRQQEFFTVRNTNYGHSFDPPPQARRSDPGTSIAAAAKHESSGNAKRHRELILDALAKRDGQTGHELGVATGLGQVECCRRLSELETERAVEPRETTQPCAVKPASKQRRWYLVRAAR